MLCSKIIFVHLAVNPKKKRNQSDTSQSRRTDGADGVLDDAGDIVRDAGDAVGDVVDDLTGETTGRSRMTE